MQVAMGWDPMLDENRLEIETDENRVELALAEEEVGSDEDVITCWAGSGDVRGRLNNGRSAVCINC